MSDKSFEDDFNDLMAPNEVAEAEPEEAVEPVEANQDAEPLADSGEPAAEIVEGANSEPSKAPVDPDKPPSWDELLAALPADKAERFKGLVEATNKDLHRLRSDAGRMSAMQHLYHEAKAKTDEVESRMRELEERAKQPMTQAESAKLATDIEDEKDSFSKEFPEFSDAVNMRFERLLKKHLPTPPAPGSAAPQQVAGQQPAPTGNDPEVASLASEYAALEAAHNDWQQAVASPVYKSWKEAQGPEMKRLIDSSKADDAIRVLDRFKLDLSVIRRRSELSRKAETKTKLAQQVGIKGAPPRPSGVPDDFESAFNFYASKG